MKDIEYYFDREIVALFLGVEPEDEAIDEYFLRYELRLSELVQEGIVRYLRDVKNYSEMDAKVELEKLVDISDFSILKRYLDDDQILAFLSEIRQNFNKQIYDYYRKTLPQETKDKINKHIELIHRVKKADFEEEKRMMMEVLDEIEEEYDRTGKVDLEGSVKKEDSVAELEEKLQNQISKLRS